MVFIKEMVMLFFIFLIKENQLYYDPATGIYYYCDVESGRYQFHSRVDLQSYQASGSQHAKDKKGKKKRKDPEWSTANEYKVTSELLWGEKKKMQDLYYFGFFIVKLKSPGIWCLEDVCFFSERV